LAEQTESVEAVRRDEALPVHPELPLHAEEAVLWDQRDEAHVSFSLGSRVSRRGHARHASTETLSPRQNLAEAVCPLDVAQGGSHDPGNFSRLYSKQ
jgi:hypothetical protein